MKLIKQDIGVWVKADIDPPEPNGRKPYRVRDHQEVEWVLFGTTTKRWDDVFEWLKPVKQVYVLTEDEIKNIHSDYHKYAVSNYQWTGETWDENTGHDDFESYTDDELFEQFINQ